MPDASHPNPRRPLRRLVVLAGAAVALGAVLWLAHALDRVTFENVYADDPLRRDWARMFRVCGYLPLWLLVGSAFWMIDAPRDRVMSWPSLRRAAWIALNPALTGLVCEVLKLIVRRERPDAALALDGPLYLFRTWEGPWWSTRGLGFPSSHVGVAAGAAAALICLYPRAWPVWVALPVGCAVTRLLDRAHTLSDCVGAMIAAVVVAAVLMPFFGRVSARRRGFHPA